MRKGLLLVAGLLFAATTLFGGVGAPIAYAEDAELKVVVDGADAAPDVTVLSPSPTSTVSSPNYKLSLEFNNASRVVVYDNGKLVHDGPVAFGAVTSQDIALTFKSTGKHVLQITAYGPNGMQSATRTLELYYWPGAPNTGGVRFGNLEVSEQSLVVVVVVVAVGLLALVFLKNERDKEKAKKRAQQAKPKAGPRASSNNKKSTKKPAASRSKK